MLRVPARKYSKISNTRSGLPVLRVKSPHPSTYILGWPINALTRPGTRPETRPEGGGAGRGRHSMVQVFSGRVYWHIEIQVFFKSIPEKNEETRIFKVRAIP